MGENLKLHMKLSAINWFGLIAGILMLVLPFAGPWWHTTVGTGAADVGISPFNVDITAFGEPMSVPIIWYVVLGARLLILATGALMLAGSLAPRRWWSGRLVRFGSTKVLWMIIGLIGFAIVGALIANAVFGLNVPYLSGSATQTLRGDEFQFFGFSLPEGVTATFLIAMTLTKAFTLAIIVAALAIVARVYHRRFAKPSEKSG